MSKFDADGNRIAGPHEHIVRMKNTDSGMVFDFVDDGYNGGNPAKPSAQRQHLARLCAAKNKQGDPLWLPMEKPAPWRSGAKLMQPLEILTVLPVYGEKNAAKVAESIAAAAPEREALAAQAEAIVRSENPDAKAAPMAADVGANKAKAGRKRKGLAG